HRTPKDFGPEFQLYLIERTRDEVSEQHSYCFNVEDDPKIFDEAINLIIHQMDVKTAFLNGELDEEVYSNQPRDFIMPGNENKVNLTKEFLSSRFSMKDMGEADVILVSTPMDTNEKLMPNNGQAVSQLEYIRVIGCLMYAMTCTRPDITFEQVRIRQKSQENRQKRANTDTRTEECARAGSQRLSSNDWKNGWQRLMGAWVDLKRLEGSLRGYK
ncbi:zinc finger, CCHC-type containing protein, partial [Tanacetum coccineum]